ncbi:zinc finger protein 436-like [Lampris incognitus]|uniref:zinc finger protein 436-like n=1 Tax=Lampris incognitus TaxID=2546036 RepID=UPI0024B48708|nr:zinc finger protein 436-like [Lampris incognitus]XP_056155726.1 zinc finger protein 436-like [Lampris incognitus]
MATDKQWSGLLESPAEEICIIFLEEQERRGQEEQREVGCQCPEYAEEKKEVGCQCPEYAEEKKEVGCQCPEFAEEKKEVGCQSEAEKRRDAAVQVNVLPQLLHWNQPDSSAVMLQCVGVKPDQPGGGALLQNCISNLVSRAVGPADRGATEQVTVQPAAENIEQNGVRTSSDTEPDPSLLSFALLPRIHLHRLSTPPPKSSSSPFLQFATRPPSGEEKGEKQDSWNPTWRPSDGDADQQQSRPPDDDSPSPTKSQTKKQQRPSCDVCEQTFGNAPQLRRHQKVVHGLKSQTSKRFVCDVCGKVMKCKASLSRHAFIHTGQKPFACHLCDLRLNRLTNLQQHLKRMHPNGMSRVEKPHRRDCQSWLCEVCGKAFECRSRFKSHSIIHSGVKPYPCDLCSKAYMRSMDLDYHKKTVHVHGAMQPPKPSTLLCDWCGKEFKCKSQLEIHYLTHTGERPHLCDLCGRRFGRLHQLQRHKICVHVNSSGKEAVSSSADSPFVCQVCGKRLKTRLLLEAHSRVHSGDKPHPCNLCSRSFTRATHLKRHYIHLHAQLNGDKTLLSRCRRDPSMPSLFSCQICGSGFKFKSWLAAHAQIHTGIKPYTCEICQRAFGRLSHLKRHREAVHANGDKTPESFICTICGKDKKCRSHLKRHMIIHTGEKPYACHLCESRFNRHGNLKQHVHRVHGGVNAPAKEELLSVFEEEEEGQGLSAPTFTL